MQPFGIEYWGVRVTVWDKIIHIVKCLIKISIITSRTMV